MALPKFKNVTIRRKSETNEWRVCPRGAGESMAYYTDDKQDAIDTAGHMDKQIETELTT